MHGGSEDSGKPIDMQKVSPGEMAPREDSFEREAREADKRAGTASEAKSEASDKDHPHHEAPDPEEDEEEVEIPLESKIGKTLSERTTRTVVMLVLVLLFLLPVFQLETWVTTQTTFETGLLHLRDMHDKGNMTSYQISYQKYFDIHTDIDMGY